MLFQEIFSPLECKSLQSSSKLNWPYPDFLRKGEDIKWVEGIRDIGQGQDKMVGFSHFKVLEHDLIRLGDECPALEDNSSNLLLLGLIQLMVFASFLEVELLFRS